jgi:hypothetical protein
MVKVYFESNGYAELVAIFDDDDTYVMCAKILERFAKRNGMILTESVEDEIELSDLIK